MTIIDDVQIYVIGGAVRDVLLHRPPTDIDYVVVGATPEYMVDVMGMHQVGADFPVFLNNDGDEYALARTERKIGNGYAGFDTNADPLVTLEQDQLRRDLTINQLAVNVDDWDAFMLNSDVGYVLDSCDGIADLNNRVLRHTSTHFADDPVRLLRIARFHAKYGFNITRQTVQLMVDMVNNGEIDHLVPERVWQEISKAMNTNQVIPFFWALNRCGALDVLIPQLKAALTSNGFAVRKASLRQKPTMVIYMLLFGGLTNPQQTLTNLKAPNDTIRMVTLFHNAVTLIHTDMSRDKILGFIKKCTNTKDTLHVLSTISEAMSLLCEQDCNQFDMVMRAERCIRYINYSSLTQEQQITLKGVDIARAIEQLRLEAITQ